MVLLVTSDNEQFNAEKDVVERSVLIKNMLEGECPLSTVVGRFHQLLLYIDVGESDQPIPLPNVSSSVLKKVSTSVTRDQRIKPTHFARSWSTASTIAVSLYPPPTLTRVRTKRANEQRTSANGTKSLSQLIKRCFSRLSLPPTTLISNPFCTFIPLLESFGTHRFHSSSIGTSDARQWQI
jgi:Skp1 family, tetramerisation domain